MNQTWRKTYFDMHMAIAFRISDVQRGKTEGKFFPFVIFASSNEDLADLVKSRLKAGRQYAPTIPQLVFARWYVDEAARPEGLVLLDVPMVYAQGSDQLERFLRYCDLVASWGGIPFLPNTPVSGASDYATMRSYLNGTGANSRFNAMARKQRHTTPSENMIEISIPKRKSAVSELPKVKAIRELFDFDVGFNGEKVGVLVPVQKVDEVATLHRIDFPAFTNPFVTK